MPNAGYSTLASGLIWDDPGMIAGAVPLWIRVLRFIFAVLGVVALAWIPIRNFGEAGFSVANYFSFFTIQSNVLGVLVLLIGSLRELHGRRWQLIRGATTLYLVITGVVYAVLLANIDVTLTDKWVNDILHRLMPIVMVVDWILVPVSLRISGRLIGTWLVYPVVYGVYTLVRGPIVDWYPYPFMDPRSQGYISLTIGLIILLGVFALLAAAVVTLSGLSNRRREHVPD